MFKSGLVLVLVLLASGCSQQAPSSENAPNKFATSCVGNILYFTDYHGRPSSPVISTVSLKPTRC